jgi:hypothetical protein
VTVLIPPAALQTTWWPEPCEKRAAFLAKSPFAASRGPVPAWS